ncbi:hypothetical protein J5295_08840 [Riemerella anatipestifer]|uniref:Uncharacterized protein n=1 Tax=Riemerella anatipestifer (strain ATCC 11845 / DSM 15868 / JCM 9532 / NCTC 11014) TaxID=693978 RepID=E4TDY0_RIEAD|nr:hypothetical protein [Riemerella anatipestifer]ADQ82989.1 hypothetical protein Riean_1836 [Riemerella anatipestifer ATCC 11845 = DSM 15868]ADZ11494.1 hypothetical protein RIA_0313 [Riemerella anatipestifer RA-GD]AFD55060.1 hypothetical protein RA0C_0037 [Riemerella anatipestifer ATCC 11845 = DSM 15868]AGC41022.1 hypothetical protein G148_1718 [Riemerella anatipestifer RA-CH-2]AKP70155.1 hypothetical protein CG08_2080 [Riemerella anatipestifer]
MENLQERILKIFSEFKTPVNGILMPQSIESRISKWDRRSQDEASNALNELISNGYVGTSGHWLTLTQKGYDFLNQGLSIEDTENVILEFLRKRNLGVGHVIMENWFISLQNQIERFHFDNFNVALNNILNKGYIEQRDNGIFLTQKGYDKLY